MTRESPGTSVAPRAPMSKLGAFADDQGTTFRLWTNAHTECAVRIDAWTQPLRSCGDGVFETRLAGIGHGASYRFVLGSEEVGDPYARYLPDGVTAPAMVYRSAYRWNHGHVTRSLREHVIYELHVGT